MPHYNRGSKTLSVNEGMYNNNVVAPSFGPIIETHPRLLDVSLLTAQLDHSSQWPPLLVGRFITPMQQVIGKERRGAFSLFARKDFA